MELIATIYFGLILLIFKNLLDKKKEIRILNKDVKILKDEVTKIKTKIPNLND